MPRDKDLKRIIRQRMDKTGEAYTAARAHIVNRKSRVSKTPAAAAPEPAPDYASIAGMSDAKIAEKTGRDWQRWVATLDELGAQTMTHTEIARIVNEQFEVDGWWSQSVTVGYERIKGLRERGQRRSGAYEVSKSRTINVPVDTLFDAWADPRTRNRWLTGAKVTVRTKTKPRSMRLGMPDGTIVAVWFESKGEAKSTAGVQHTKLPDRETAERMKEFWAERLQALAALLAPAAKAKR